MAGPCEPGDVLGVIEGDFVIVGADQYDVATGVLDPPAGRRRRARDDRGAAPGRTPPRWPSGCGAWVEETHPLVDAVVYDGGQERYPFLVSVE